MTSFSAGETTSHVQPADSVVIRDSNAETGPVRLPDAQIGFRGHVELASDLMKRRLQHMDSFGYYTTATSPVQSLSISENEDGFESRKTARTTSLILVEDSSRLVNILKLNKTY